ncbi:MAG TPA: hypothetical protein PKH58_08560 [Paludibacteraceae bacterium]|nr:hypothetical protein [Paludibacteraceae bacterium]HPT43959.1 hypothetical protein [Paludibacteraceae bacterium]
MKKVFLFIAVAFAIAACAPKQAEEKKVQEDSVVVVDTVAAPADTAIASVDSVAPQM